MDRFTPRFEVWLEVDGKRVIGSSEAKILEGIQKLGSFMAASKAVGVSYAHAWNLVDNMRRILGEPIVEARKGGEFGGGAHLTDVGLNLLNSYYELEKRVRESVEGASARAKRKGVVRRPIKLPEFTIVGSDCVGLEILVGLMRRERSFTYEIVRVGSSGGLSAIMLGEADVAGVHLLDEETGEYNTPFLRRYWIADRAALIRGYIRDIGLIVPKDNPKNIQSIQDLLRRGVRMVNRTLGSGTRALQDMLLRRAVEKRGLKFNEVVKRINGYSVEVHTHTEVAKAVAEGKADVGFGVKYAANIYGLDFIPITQEYFDFVAEETRLRKPLLKLFMEKLASKEFKNEAEKTGLHTLDNTGMVIYKP
jgi:molybdate transport repressor ModE-like protein